MSSISSLTSQLQATQVREAMLQLRADRAEKVQRIMQKIAGRDAQTRSAPATDPTGNRGNSVDLFA